MVGKNTKDKGPHQAPIAPHDKCFTVLQVLEDGLLLTGSAGQIQLANPAFCRMLGAELTQLRGRSLQEALLPCFRSQEGQRLTATISQALAGEQVPTDTYTFHSPAGAVRYTDITLTRLGDLSEPGAGLVIHLTDVTGRVMASHALRESEARFRSIFEHAAIGIAQVDLQGTFLRVNNRFCAILGYRPEGLLGRAFREITHPEDQRPNATNLAMLATGQLDRYVTEQRYLRQDGSSVWVALTVSVIHGASGEPKNFISLIEDISERKQLELDLQQRSQELNKGLRQLDCLYRISRLQENRALTLPDVLYGITESIPVGLKDPDNWGVRLSLEEQHFSSESYLEGGCEYARRITVAGEPVGSLEVGRAVEAQGSHDQLSEEDRQLLDVITEHVGRVIDRQRAIEEREQMEEQLRLSQKMEAIGTLAGGIAHDFNNLLTAIISFGGLALEAVPSGSQVGQDLEQVLQAARQAASLTRQLLAFSRRQTVQPKVLDLNQIVQGMEKMLQRLIGEHIELRCFTDEQPAMVLADPGQLDQVVLNLAVNARDAMSQGGRLTIETGRLVLDEHAAQRMELPAGRYVMMAVSDTGCGMDEKTRERVFEPFFTTKSLGHGTGLGMSVIYGIVKQSGGRVWIYSEPERGTTIKVYLPQVDSPQLACAPIQPQVRRLLGCERVLVVEDEPLVRALVLRVLEDHGYQVLVAESGPEALMRLEQASLPVQLVLTDVVMPEMNGKELVKRVQRRMPGIKHLFMSGYADHAIFENQVLDKDMPFLAKPFTEDELLRRVRQVLDD